METIARVMQVIPPPSGRPPEINLAPRDVAALADELTAYHALFAPLFARAEQRRGAWCYLRGQLLDLERKTIEPLALALPDGDVQALQQFISQSTWDAEAVLLRHQEIVAATLGDAETGVLIVDGCDFPKQGPDVWVVLRRSLGDAPTLKTYLSNASADTPLATLVWLCGMRWPVETGILEAKGEVGLDHYEVRGWVGWHHHITLSFLAHHFLLRARLRVGEKKPGADRAAGAPAAPGRAAAPTPRHPHGAAPPVLHPAAELCRLSVPPHAHPPAARFVLTL